MFEEQFGQVFGAIIAADTEASFQAFEMLLGRPIREDEIEPRNAMYRHIGKSLSAVDYLNARTWLGMWVRRMAEWWTSYDVLVTPTLGGPPPELGWFTADGPEQEGARIVSFIPYTAQFNMTGQPAVSLPLHWSADGLPVGVQFVGAYGREDLLVRLAAQLEQAAPWADRRPPYTRSVALQHRDRLRSIRSGSVPFWCEALGYVVEPPPEDFPTLERLLAPHRTCPTHELPTDIDAADSIVDPSGVGPRFCSRWCRSRSR